MKKVLFTTALIALSGAALPLFAQAPLKSSHQPVFPSPEPTLAAGAAAKAALAPIARVNGVAITQTQLDEEMQRLFPYYSIHGGRIPPGAEADLRQQAIHDAVLHELIYQEARRRRLQISPAKWQQRLQRIRKGFPSRQAYESAAIKEYGSVAEFERRLRRVMLIEQLWQSEVISKSAITTQEARAYYESHKSQYVRPEAVWLQTITTKVPASATAEQKQQARKIAEEILVKAKAAKTYDEFGILAEKLSQDDWRVMMGDHRWVHRGTVTGDLEQVIFKMKPGETSGVLETPAGYVILRANGHQPQRQMSFTEMEPSIRQRLQEEKLAKRSREFEQSLRSKAKVEVL